LRFQEIVERLREETGASRTTLRLDVPGLNFPAVAESVGPGIKPIRADNSLDQRGAATAQRLFATRDVLVQPDTATADPPPPRPLLDVYGVKAQMLSPVARDGEIVGWLSVHYNPSPRVWEDGDVEALRAAAARVEAELARTRAPGLRDVGEGVRLWTVDVGTGLPIVLLHGWGTNSSIWRLQLAGLAGEHRVLAIDQRGFGSSPGASPATTARLAADVRLFLDSQEIEDAFLLGWSMGGLVAMSYCEQFGSHRLRAVGIVDVSPRLTAAEGWGVGEGVGREIGEGLERWRAMWPERRREVFEEITTVGFRDPGAHAADIAWAVEESMRTDPEFGMQTFVDLFARDFRESVGRIDVPALLMYGGHSTSTTRFVADYMASAIPTAQLELFAESGHALFLEEPERFNRVVDAFAKQHSSKRVRAVGAAGP
jgi:maleate isomerase